MSFIISPLYKLELLQLTFAIVKTALKDLLSPSL